MVGLSRVVCSRPDRSPKRHNVESTKGVPVICFITDIREGEMDILSPVKHEPLLILGLDGGLIDQVLAPASGWTHDALIAQGERLTPKTKQGAEAFLGSVWVGGTEV